MRTGRGKQSPRPVDKAYASSDVMTCLMRV